MPLPTGKGQSTDVAATRLQLNNAEDERLVQSWFSSFTKDTINQGSGSAEDDVAGGLGENDERSGLGYVAPRDQSLEARQSLGNNEKLRKQLLGKSAGNGLAKGNLSGKMPAGLQASKPKPRSKRALPAGSDDENEARTTSISRKSNKNASTQSFSAAETISASNTKGSSSKRGSSTKPANYLDELLAQRASKQKKRKKG